MKKSIWICAVIILHCGATLAAVTLSSTRIVYPAQSRFADVAAENAGKEPSQILAWVDDGDAASTPETASAPFLLMPAVSIVRPGRKQTVRIVYNGGTLPSDREIVYYLNLLEIPPKRTESRAAPEMNVAVRSRIKIFMRPASLAGEPLDAVKKMVWDVVTEPAGPTYKAKNASPYFVSLVGVKLMRGNAELSDLGGGMVPPWGELEFRADAKRADLAGATNLKYGYVNDHGGIEELTFTLSPR